MSLDNIFGRPTYVEDVGYIYPIRLKDWDAFEEHLDILVLSKNHIDVGLDIPLLDRLLFLGEETILSLCQVFNLVTRTDSFKFKTFEDEYYFINNKNQVVNNFNYDKLRKVVLYQNIIFEPKIYKSKIVQEWAKKALKQRQKNAPNVTLEDMITTVAALSGKDYDVLENYTIYQLKSEFNRWCKIKNYDTTVLSFANANVDPKSVNPEYFAEYLDLYKNPYDDLFKNKDEMQIGKVIKNK